MFALFAIGSSLTVAAWITVTEFPTLASAALPGNSDRTTFEDRFVLAPMSAGSSALRTLKRAAQELPTTARDVLASRWMPADFRPTLAANEEPAPVVTRPVNPDAIPLPRSRPVIADLEARPSSALALADNKAARPPERSLLQKLSDLIPGRLTLASLAPGGGLFNRGPDLTAFGYDGSTAVYDISARAVYMPNGTILEAHSGLGGLRDNPDHVSVPNAGATPPAVYSLKLRESEFHGVAALRMIPVEGSDIGGRSGLLVHSFMLGPNGDSNGCVSIKDYDRFLRAFNAGEVNRIVVVPSLKAQVLASQNPT